MRGIPARRLGAAGVGGAEGTSRKWNSRTRNLPKEEVELKVKSRARRAASGLCLAANDNKAGDAGIHRHFSARLPCAPEPPGRSQPMPFRPSARALGAILRTASNGPPSVISISNYCKIPSEFSLTSLPHRTPCPPPKMAQRRSRFLARSPTGRVEVNFFSDIIMQ